MDPSFEWVVKNGGINTEEGYPYISGTGQAKFCKWIKVKIFLNLFFFFFLLLEIILQLLFIYPACPASTSCFAMGNTPKHPSSFAIFPK